MTEQQYFHPGERVLLVSKNRPECSGEYTVFDAVMDDCVYSCRITGLNVRYPKKSGIGYRLCRPFVDIRIAEGVEATWAQSSLRKIHKPSEFSFEELMNDCKTHASAS